MNIREVTEACIGAGFRGDALVEIVAIAGRESNWSEAVADTNAFSERNADGRWYNPETGATLPAGIGPEYSVGPFQINLNVHALSYDDAMNPNTAAVFAFGLSQGGTDFSPWSTEAGMPEHFRDQARAAIADVNGETVTEQPIVVASQSEVPNTRRVVLDVAQAQTALWTGSKCVSAGVPAYLSEGPGDDQVTIEVTMTRGELAAAWPALAEILPA